jgi:Immunity protein 50
MTWLDLAENPEAVKGAFDVAPSLKNVGIISVHLDRDRPTVVVEVALNEKPSKLSFRWERNDVNAVNLNLELLGVESLKLDGWASENSVAIGIHPGNSTKIAVHITGLTTQFRCGCGSLRIGGLAGYHRESPSKELQP